MSITLKRPMFRRGGSTNTGIMSGLVDREQKSFGDVAGRVEKLTPEFEKLLSQYTPRTRLPLGEVGFALATGTPFLEALGAGYRQFTKADDARQRAIKSGALKLGIAEATKKQDRTELQKNLIAAGLVPGTEEFETALKTKILQPKDTRTTAEKNADALGLTGEDRAAYIKAATIQTEALGGEFATKANRDKALKAGNYAVESMDFMIDVAKLGVRSPESFGVKGRVLGFGKDLATELEGIFDSSLRSAADEGISAGVYDLVKNPDFSKIQPLENAMSIRLARTRNPQDKLMKDMIRDAKQDTDLSGLGGAAKIRDRLPVIFREFLATARNRLRSAGRSDEEIASILNPKIEEFNTLMSQFAGVTAVDDKEFKIPGRGGKGKKQKFKLELIDGVYRKIPIE